MNSFKIGDTEFEVGDVKFSLKDNIINLEVAGSEDVFGKLINSDNNKWNWALYAPKIYFRNVPYENKEIVVNESFFDKYDAAFYMMEYNDFICTLKITDKDIYICGQVDIMGTIESFSIKIVLIKAVIFDMYETLITHFKTPLYFGTQMAVDAGIPKDKFDKLWQLTENDRTIGKMTLEEAIEAILRENNCYSKELLNKIVQKRIKTKEDCFNHMNEEILPLLRSLKEKDIKIGLISNCFSEEADVIKKSILFPYFDAVCLSYEQGLQKPDEGIYRRCIDKLKVKANECLYVGDGGSFELEAAEKFGMRAVQAAWYLQDGTNQFSGRNAKFEQIENPMDILNKI